MKVVRGALTLGVLAAVLAWPARAGEPAPEVGIASHYGPGTGVAVQWCSWTRRHSSGCGWVQIQSHDTGIVVTAPVVDWCQCYRGTPDERLVDLQYGVLTALGLPEPFTPDDRGLYEVSVWRIEQPGRGSAGPPSLVAGDGVEPVIPPATLPDTAVQW